MFLLSFAFVANTSNLNDTKKSIEIKNSTSISVTAGIVYPVKIGFTPFLSGDENVEMVVYASDTTTVLSHFKKHVQSATDTTIYIGSGKFYLVSLSTWPLNLKPPYVTGVDVSSTGSYNMNNLLTTPFRVSPIKVLCEGKYILEAKANYSGTGTLKYKWTPSEGLNNDTIQRPKTDINSSRTYTVSVNSSDGFSASTTVFVDVPSLTANAGKDTSAVYGSNLLLKPVTTNFTGLGKLRYKWTPSSGLNNDTIVQPTVTVTSNTLYSVSVTAPGGCIASDTIMVSIAQLPKPEIGIVSVSANNKNLIAWNKTESGIINSYSVYKETTVSNIYEKIGTIPYDSLSVYEDNQSTPKIKSNKYKLSAVDKSGLETELSVPHKTIHLSINKGQGNSWNLIWEPYEGFTVATYNIYRGTSTGSLNFLDAVSGSSTQFSDFNVQAGDVYYQLEVISPLLVNPSKINGPKKANNSVMISYNSSRSNIAFDLYNGLNKTNKELIAGIYPNPAKDHFLIKGENISSVEILNLTGQLINRPKINSSCSVDISDLPTGAYLVKLKQGNSMIYSRIVKQ